MSECKTIVMLGTSFCSMGGVSAVINGYREAGLFARFPITYLPTHSDGNVLTKLRFFLKAWLAFQALLLRRRIRLLHVHMSSNASFWRKLFFLMPAFATRIPAILHLHGGAFHNFYERSNNPVKKYLIRLVLDRVQCIIVLSETRKAWIQSISSNRRVHTIYNAVHVPALPLRGAARNAELLFLGQLTQAKGVYDLLHAIRMLVDRHPGLQLHLAGDGPQDEVQAVIDGLGLAGHVHMLGWVTGKDKSRLLRQAAIFTLPSYAEGMPMSILEAMAVGLPVVATTVGGIPEVISDGAEGILVKPGDVGALVAAFDMLLSDPAMRTDMGTRGRQKVEQVFSYQKIIPQIEQLYRELARP